MRCLKTILLLSVSTVLLAGCAAVQTASNREHSNGVLFPSINGDPPTMAATMTPEAPIASEDLAAPMQDALTIDPMDASGGAAGGSQRVPLGSLTAAPAAPAMAQPPPPPAPPTMSPEAAMAMSAAAAESDRQREFRPLPAPLNTAAAEEATRRSEMDAANAERSTMREFVPASMTVARSVRDEPGVMLSAADRNIMRRFEALKRLRDQELITIEEYEKRRAVNIGGILPYSKPVPGAGLERSVPAPEAIIARIAALGRSLEMRAITPRQHQLERSMILNALLPEAPETRAPRRPPPADLLEAASMVGKLELLRVENLISEAEFDAESEAIEAFMRTGRFPGDRLPERRSAAQTGAMQAPAPAAASAPAPEPPITGPLLHLASFRSEEAAMKGWTEAQAKAGAVLAEKRPVVKKADLGAQQGIFYRLMTGPFTNFAAAEQTCVELKKVNQFCRPTEDGT